MFVIAGLGNPGRKYEKTRHNMGFLAIDSLAEKNGIKVNKIKHRALVGDGMISDRRVLLVKPQTYMNLSGISIREIAEATGSLAGTVKSRLYQARKLIREGLE